MNEGSDLFPETEAVPRPATDIPDSELAHEIGDASDADLHGDPDDPSPVPPPGEAAAMSDWRVAKSLLTLRAQVNALAPARSKASDGTIGDPSHQSRASDHNPWVNDGNIGVVTAMDITNDPEHGCGAEMIATAIRNTKDTRVKYIIWNRRIANSSAVGGAAAWGWRDYHGTNGHTHHIHISVKPEKASYDSETPWTLPGTLVG
ncbi:hypothetical protein NKH85_12515 [Mesorhizobium sp. M0924]|uniref:hypothetical protein n=1 Tax=unclassified Mesorhizobium TaxID=325217 RepID=UPI00333B11B5